MIKQFLSSIGYRGMKVDTIVDAPNIAFGDTLDGKIYIEGGQSEHLIDHIDLEIIRRTEQYRTDSDFDVHDQVIAKHSIELVNVIKSKETKMIPFEIVPDERWLGTTEHEKLILRTKVSVKNAVDLLDEDEISYK